MIFFDNGEAIAMFGKDRVDYKREDTASTYNEERAEKLREFIGKIQDEYRFEDEEDCD